MTEHKILLSIHYGTAESNRRKAEKNVNCKNAATLGARIKIHKRYLVETEEISKIEAGSGKTMRKIYEELQRIDYEGNFYVLLHRSPRVSWKYPKKYRKGKGPVPLFKGSTPPFY